MPTGTLYSLESQTVNTRFSIRGTDRSLVKDFVIVAVDDRTFSYFEQRRMPYNWPFPRRYHARVIDTLLKAGAKVIAFDVAFTAPTDPADDNALIAALGRAHNTVLATTFVYRNGTTPVLAAPRSSARSGRASATAP